MSTTTPEIGTPQEFAVVSVDPHQETTSVPMTATCAPCGGLVLREARWNGADLVLEAWRHAGGTGESDHLVTQIFLGDR